MTTNKESNRLVILFEPDFVKILSEWKNLCYVKDITQKDRLAFLIKEDRENLKRVKESK